MVKRWCGEDRKPAYKSPAAGAAAWARCGGETTGRDDEWMRCNWI